MEDNSPNYEQLIDRRSILRYGAVGGALGLAGCTGGGGSTDTDAATNTPTGTAERTPLSTE